MYRGGTMTTMKNKSWDESYADLVAYHKRHGHCGNPKRGDKEYPKLGAWINAQRQHWRKRIHLRQDQVNRLDTLGFIWVSDRCEKAWNDKFERLKWYKLEYGDFQLWSTRLAGPITEIALGWLMLEELIVAENVLFTKSTPIEIGNLGQLQQFVTGVLTQPDAERLNATLPPETGNYLELGKYRLKLEKRATSLPSSVDASLPELSQL